MMYQFNEEILQNNLNSLVDQVDNEGVKKNAKEQPSFRSFYLSNWQESVLIFYLETFFDKVYKPSDENGPERKADAVCFINGKEFRFQLKQAVTDSIRSRNGEFKENNKTIYVPDLRLIKSRIDSNPNHKSKKNSNMATPYYKRSDLDVMVADISAIFGRTKFLYKLVDNFVSPDISRKKKKPHFVNEIHQYITNTQNLDYNIAGYWEDGWVEDFNLIMSELMSDSYNLRDYSIDDNEVEIQEDFGQLGILFS